MPGAHYTNQSSYSTAGSSQHRSRRGNEAHFSLASLCRRACRTKRDKTGRFAKSKKLARYAPGTFDAPIASCPVFNPLEPSPYLRASVVPPRIPSFMVSLASLDLCNAHLPTSHFLTCVYPPGPENAATNRAGAGLICMRSRTLTSLKASFNII